MEGFSHIANVMKGNDVLSTKILLGIKPEIFIQFGPVEDAVGDQNDVLCKGVYIPRENWEKGDWKVAKEGETT